MKKVVILGSGLATRLYPITSHIPKVLVNYKQHTVLKHLYDLYTNVGAEEIIVVVHSKFKDLVQGYAKTMGLTITVRCVDEAYGSMYAINKIHSDVDGHNVIYNWCDVIPKFYGRREFDWGKNKIYTYGDKCRYSFKDGKIDNVGATGGNIVGIYQTNFDFLEPIPDYITKGHDFVEFLKASDFQEESLFDLIDIGDIPKLRQAHDSKELNREFNEITLKDGYVIKKALNPKGEELQKKELNWYLNLKGVRNVPMIYMTPTETCNIMTMERIYGSSMYEKFTPELLPRILKESVFGDRYIPEKNQIDADIKQEAYTKVIDRCASIQDMIDSFGIKYVNGVKIGSLNRLLKRVLPHLKETEYQLIHGDLNFSNIMLSDDNEIKFIDPRGYFGHTELYGPRTYDEAKILYALSGYDEFNADPLWGGLSIEGDSAIVDIKPLMTDYLDQDFVTPKHKLWLGIIWIALGGYFKNNPLKAVSAYFYGMYLLTSFVKGLPRVLTDGAIVPETKEPVTASIITKCPSKWELHDRETGQVYMMNHIQSELHKQWILIK